MSGHTPGPWLYFYKHKYDEHHVSLPLSGRSFRLHLFDDGCRTESAEADARLIAAAPDLLNALIAILEEVEGCYVSSEKQGRAAIAKATGVSS